MFFSSSSSSNTPKKQNWQEQLDLQLKANYENYQNQSINIPLASMQVNLQFPRLQNIRFEDILSFDDRVLLFSGSTDNGDLMRVVKNVLLHQAMWVMSKTGDIFTFTGKIYTVTDPALSHRFGSAPRLISIDEQSESKDSFWENLRLSYFKGTLNHKTSRLFQPSPPRTPVITRRTPIETSTIQGVMSKYDISVKTAASMFGKSSPPVTLDEGEKPLTDVVAPFVTAPIVMQEPSPVSSTYSLPRSTDEQDVFCLLVMKVTQVDHIQMANGSQSKRTIYTSLKEGGWDIEIM